MTLVMMTQQSRSMMSTDDPEMCKQLSRCADRGAVVAGTDLG